MKPSKYQLDFYNEVKNTNNNIILEACAGSGKTHSLVEALKLIPKYKKTISLAFNKSIASEMSEKVPLHVECSTLHSLGYKIIRKNRRGKIKVTKYKNIALLKDITEGLEIKKDDILPYKFRVSDIVNYCRITRSGRDEESLRQLAMKYGILIKSTEISSAIQCHHYLESKPRRRNHLPPCRACPPQLSGAVCNLLLYPRSSELFAGTTGRRLAPFERHPNPPPSPPIYRQFRCGKNNPLYPSGQSRTYRPE